MLELGLVGFILVMTLFVYLAFIAGREAVYQRNPQAGAICAAACAFLLISVTENMVYNAVYSAHYWGMVGVAIHFMKERVSNDISVNTG
jgi:cell division protein FtsW (lipid II flippase)